MTTIIWNKPISLAAVTAFALSALSVSGVAIAQDSGYVKDGTAKTTVRSGFGTCVRTGYWTPAMATEECDPDLVKKPEAKPAAKPEAKPAAKPEAKPAAKPEAKPAAKPAAPVTQKVTLAADVLFDFDKAVVKTEGQKKLDELVGKMKAVNLEVIIAIGHTDSIGSDAYNQRLSMRRSQAVKAYLVSKGIEANRIYTEGKGEKQPVASNATKEGRQKNRRVDIEVVGTTAKPEAAPAKPEAKPEAKPAAR